MHILATVRYIHLNAPLQNYWNKDVVKSLMSSMIKLKFWNAFQYIEDGDVYLEYFKIKDKNHLENYLLNADAKNYRAKKLSFDKSGKSYLSLTLNPQEISLIMSIDFSETVDEKLLHGLQEFLLEFLMVLPEVSNIGHEVQLSVPEVSFHKIRPTYTIARCRWIHNSILDIIDERHLAQDQAEQAAVVKAIANLPPFVEYKKEGHFHVLTWINDLSDETIVAQCLTERNKWLHRYIPLKLDSWYNELGDGKTEDVYLGMDTHPFLTYYSESYDEDFEVTYLGFQSVVVLPDGNTDMALLQNLSVWVKQKKLPDGSPIDNISLIIQDRESALLILDKAKELGLDQVLYMDDHEQFWAVNPPGLWLN